MDLISEFRAAGAIGSMIQLSDQLLGLTTRILITEPIAVNLMTVSLIVALLNADLTADPICCGFSSLIDPTLL